MHKKIEKEQPRIEILGDHTVLYYADGRTSVLRGISKQDVVGSPLMPPLAADIANEQNQHDSLTHTLALGLTVVAGVRAGLQIGFSWVPGFRGSAVDDLVSQLIGSIKLRAHRRPKKARSHERDNASPSATAYS